MFLIVCFVSGYLNRAQNEVSFQGAQLLVPKLIQAMFIEASTSLGSMQKFEGAAGNSRES